MLSRQIGKSRSFAAELRQDNRGTAGIEFAMVLSILLVLLLNGVEGATYYFQRMEVENASQMAVQAAWKTCDEKSLPATVNCPDLTSALTTALHSTSLGSNVSMASGSPSEGYYCADTNGDLQLVSAVSSKPADCSSVGDASTEPGDYIKVSAEFAYQPIFPTISIVSALPSTMSETSYMRLD